METLIGCSGYYYNHWKGLFYPPTLPKKKWLSYYSEHFNTVEINNTFYKMPEEKTLRNWYELTPPNFVFSLKGFRNITHLKKLSYDATLLDSLDQFLHTAAALKDKSGPILWQLPPSLKVDIPKLEKFCSLLSHDFQHVFEFRDVSWWTQEVYDVLEKYKHSLCIVSAPGKIPEVIMTTSETAYVRFHGKGSWYNDNYSNEDLQSWKQRLEPIPAQRLYAFFNNDTNAYAVGNALYLASLYGTTPQKLSDSKQMLLF
ncbi:MAG TPA: DUF72 domain-containing protein [Prolixibacteraceae bacterium]|jgi:uncharacterized protein YecE (DUF72 family)|nr:DUF72 domain-containing protein [Prolixibacteraceae bacterium]